MSSPQVFEIAFKLGGMIDSSMRKAFDAASKSMKGMDGDVSSFGTASSVASGSVKLLAGAAVGATAAIGTMAAGLGVAVANANEFDESMRQLQASTGSSAEEMKEIKKISENLYNNNYGEDWNDLNKAISTTKQVTDLAGRQLENATANALTYRDVFEEDVAESIKTADTLMKNFGITNTQSYNLLSQGAQNGLNKTGELLDMTNEFAVHFKTLDFSANEMFDIFNAGLSEGAFNLSVVGDAIKEFNIRSKDGSTASAEAYALLNMNAAEMTKTFAAGGPAAQQAFKSVVNAIAELDDPVARNTASVGLFGTMAEDLESDVIKAMGTVRSEFDMTKDTMKDIESIKFDTSMMKLQGIKREIETKIIIPIGEQALPVLDDLLSFTQKIMPSIKESIETNMSAGIEHFNAFRESIKTWKAGASDNIGQFKSIMSGMKENLTPVFKSISDTVVPLVKNIGDTAVEAFSTIYKFWQSNGPEIVNAVTSIFKTIGAVAGGLFSVFQTVFTIVQPFLIKIINFVMDIVGQILVFWDKEGAQIITAVQNVFSIINKVIGFLAPVIISIINMVWSNVKGVIQGAFKVITGLVKLFSGIFTGDFSKMWQGIKDIFFGAIQAVWNYLNLLFLGRILGGIKALATNALGPIKTMWTNVSGFFKNGSDDAWQLVVNMGTKIRNAFTSAKDGAVNIARSMWKAVRGIFDDIVGGAKSLPGKIGQGIASMAGKAIAGVISMGQRLLNNVGNMVNSLISGLNWVLSKIGVDTRISKWSVPQIGGSGGAAAGGGAVQYYANGTAGHPGGLAVLGDGRGSNAGSELFRTPDGNIGLSPATDTLMNLPRGTQVISASETAKIMSQMNIPAYANGTISNAISTGVGWVKDKAFDIFSYISEPSKLLNKMLEQFGVSVPNMSGIMGDIAKGSLSMLKDKSLTFLKSKLEGIMGSSSDFSGSGSNMARSAIMQALSITGQAQSWLPAMMKIAHHESGFNPRAINLWDINAQRGIPSKGMFQTIDPTFNAYKLKGMNDIYNPLHNAVAAIRYMLSRYGGIGGHPGIRSMASGGGYKPYYKGGRTGYSQWALVGERGPELLKLPGGANIFNNTDTKNRLNNLLEDSNGQGVQKSVQSYASTDEKVVFAPIIHVSGGGSASEVKTAAEEAIQVAFERFMEWYNNLQKDKKRLSFED
ncbi:phage tail tape measure protein [Jeotgalibacillus terrae]|uniref:Phage tail tape measure protein n=1 Tax=Jeotgalibacillus terrae TaxID=587735 RepID=A0ABW5ZEY0_9BACL|nr:phage tail tape measure protein [Jeotgalibacillus terrae]MBM7580005.1 SLT domain-containing protein/phage-related minor tail protein [Jeotgalibacillus terrae]